MNKLTIKTEEEDLLQICYFINTNQHKQLLEILALVIDRVTLTLCHLNAHRDLAKPKVSIFVTKVTTDKIIVTLYQILLMFNQTIQATISNLQFRLFLLFVAVFVVVEHYALQVQLQKIILVKKLKLKRKIQMLFECLKMNKKKLRSIYHRLLCRLRVVMMLKENRKALFLYQKVY